MNIIWTHLEQPAKIAEWIAQSHRQPVLFFKHSIRCSISSTVLHRLERTWKPDSQIAVVYVDLINFRSVSDQLAQTFQVQHESPQAILIEGGVVVGHWSHLAIDWHAINAALVKN